MKKTNLDASIQIFCTCGRKQSAVICVFTLIFIFRAPKHERLPRENELAVENRRLFSCQQVCIWKREERAGENTQTQCFRRSSSSFPSKFAKAKRVAKNCRWKNSQTWINAFDGVTKCHRNTFWHFYVNSCNVENGAFWLDEYFHLSYSLMSTVHQRTNLHVVRFEVREEDAAPMQVCSSSS